jgi:hypothetical protein
VDEKVKSYEKILQVAVPVMPSAQQASPPHRNGCSGCIHEFAWNCRQRLQPEPSADWAANAVSSCYGRD